LTHYHLAFSDAHNNIFGQLFYDNYEESLVDLHEFSVMMFSNIQDHPDSLTFDAAMRATEYGHASIVLVGSSSLCIYWLKCERCQPPSLN